MTIYAVIDLDEKLDNKMVSGSVKFQIGDAA